MFTLPIDHRRVSIYSELSADAAETSFSLSRARDKHSVGAMAWGRSQTEGHLFASSEPEQEDYTGFHKAFDVGAEKIIYEFDEKGSGDAIAITDDGKVSRTHPLNILILVFDSGSKLALITRKLNRTHSLRLYDIRGRNPSSILSTSLSSFSPNIEGEINCAAFSSDGIYVALGRNDNHTHVYDSRMLDRILFDYEHYGPCRTTPGAESFGVVQVQWVEGHSINLPMGLVTGGNDGGP